MIFTLNRMTLACVAGLGLSACDAPTLVSLQPIGAPLPSNSQQTFVDADGCSWWIVGNGDDLRWAPMTNSVGEHVCDGGATRFDPPVAGALPVAGELPATAPDTLASELDAAIEETSEATAVPITAAPEAEPQAETAPEPAPAPSEPVAGDRSYFVQVATFAREANASASEALFSSLGYTIDSGADVRDNDNLYRLILGPFPNREEAQKAVERAFNEGFDDAFPFRK